MAKPDQTKRGAREVRERHEVQAHVLCRAEVAELSVAAGVRSSGSLGLVSRDWLRLRDEFDTLLDGFHGAGKLFTLLKLGLHPTRDEWDACAKAYNAATDIGEREENWQRAAAGKDPVQHIRLGDHDG